MPDILHLPLLGPVYVEDGDPAIANLATLRTQAANALAANQTYLGLGAPTNPQVVAQVASLTRQVNALIRLTVGQLNTTAGT